MTQASWLKRGGVLPNGNLHKEWFCQRPNDRLHPDKKKLSQRHRIRMVILSGAGSLLGVRMVKEHAEDLGVLKGKYSILHVGTRDLFENRYFNVHEELLP